MNFQDRFERGRDNGFGITGIQEETLEKYSQRHAQKQAAIVEFLDKNGWYFEHEIARRVRDTRAEKLAEISTARSEARGNSPA